MADDTLYIDLSLLSGLNTVDAETDLNPGQERQADGSFGKLVTPLREAPNVIITNERKPETRLGYNKVMAGDSTHSLWSNGTMCLFVEGSRLYMLNDDYSLTMIRDGLMVGARMTYKQWGDRIYYSNKYQIGWIAAGPVTDIREDGSIVERTDDVYSDHNIRPVDEEEAEPSVLHEIVFQYPEPATLFMQAGGETDGVFGEPTPPIIGKIEELASAGEILMSGEAQRFFQVPTPTSISFDSAAYDEENYMWQHTIGSGSNGILLVGIAGTLATDVTGVTFGGVPLTKHMEVSGEGRKLYLWYLEDPAVGEGTILIAGSDYAQVASVSISLFGVGTLETPGVGSTAAGVSVTAVASGQTTNGWILDLLSYSGSASPASSQTLRVDGVYGMTHCYGSTKVASSDPDTLEWTTGGGSPALLAVVPITKA